MLWGTCSAGRTTRQTLCRRAFYLRRQIELKPVRSRLTPAIYDSSQDLCLEHLLSLEDSILRWGFLQKKKKGKKCYWMEVLVWGGGLS